LIASSADIKAAKSLLDASGVNKRTEFKITVKASDEIACAVAEECAKIWNEQLGMNCSVRKLGYKVYDDMNGERLPGDPLYNPDASEYENLVFDLYLANYLAGGKDVVLSAVKQKKLQNIFIRTEELEGFDIIAVDMQQMSMDAFATLASYATYFNGGAMDLGQFNSSEGQDADAASAADHITGYYSEEYNELINRAYAEKDLKKRAEILHQAEELLIKDMPVMPLFVYQNGYLISDELKGISYGWSGVINYAKVKYPSYVAPVEDYSQPETPVDKKED
jgi:ABC-type transport system substrate-binding protein